MKTAAMKSARPRGAWLRTNARSALMVLGAFRQTRLGWLLPLMIVLFFFALIFFLLGSAGPLAPFVYPLM